MMNLCWPCGTPAQQLDRPLYDSNTLAILAHRYQPSLMNALINQNNNIAHDNNSQILTSTSNNNNNNNNINTSNTNNNNNNIINSNTNLNINNNNNDENEIETTTASNRNNPAKRIWRPLDLMK